VAGLAELLEARDFLLAHRTDYEFAYRHYNWPQLDEFNCALDYFDVMAAGNARPALWVVDDAGAEVRLGSGHTGKFDGLRGDYSLRRPQRYGMAFSERRPLEFFEEDFLDLA